MKFFASELAHYDVDDVGVAVRKLMYTEREEGQTAFPDLPTLDRCISDVKNARLRAARERLEREAEEAEARDRREHPENYFDVREMARDFVKTKSIVISPERSVVAEAMALLLESFSEEDFLALAQIVKQRTAMRKPVRTV